ncbi:MAG: PKD domain-containing protein [Thiolinea sp.]
MRWWGLLLIGLLIHPVFAGPEDVYSLKIRAFLQGAYAADTLGLMHDTLRQKSLIPHTQPFNNQKFAYDGVYGLDPALLEISGENAVVDWVLVELRDPDDPHQIVKRKAALLQRDGDIADAATGKDVLEFSWLTKPAYYIAVHHRNHLGTMTASPVAIDSIPTVDFSDAGTVTNREHDRIMLTTEIAALRAGYVNTDQRMIASGPGNDMSEILTRVLTATENTDFNTNFIQPGYFDSDLNLDGQTTFAGPANDAQILLGNVLSHPLNTGFSGNFIISSMQNEGREINNLPVDLLNLGDFNVYFLPEGEGATRSLNGIWRSGADIDSIFIKISDAAGYFEENIIQTDDPRYFTIPSYINPLRAGSYRPELKLEACQDAGCSSVYSDSQVDLDVRIDVKTAAGNSPPVARPYGLAETVLAKGEVKQFSGALSFDADNDLLSHYWKLVSKPDSSQLEFSSEIVNPTFQPDQPGVYVFEYYVSDGELLSTISTLTVRAINGTPEAGFTYPELMKIAGAIQLNGSSSSDPENDALSYQWRLVSRPDGAVMRLEDTESAIISFSPDIPGEYRVQLTVSDGYSSHSVDHTLVVHPENSRPVARVAKTAFHAVPGQSTVLDAGSSIDVDDDTLSYHWSLMLTPENSAAVLNDNNDPVMTFIPDIPGEYRLQLLVNDGQLDSEPLEIIISVVNSAPLLNHNVLDAEFSQSLNRIVTIGTNPNRLYIVNPVTQEETSVELAVVPNNVSVGPDGKFAVVGHDAWVSHVDLENAVVLNTYPVTANAADIVLDGNNYAHVMPADGYWVRVHSINLDTGEETQGSGGLVREGTQIKLHQSGRYLYGANRESSPSDLEKLDISSGSAVQLYDSVYHGDHNVCGDFWLSEDGVRIFSKCKNVFRSHASNNREQDMLFNGQLTGLDVIEHLSHSSAANLVFAIAIEDEQANGYWNWQSEQETVARSLNIYGYDFLELKRSIDFDSVVSNGERYDSHGRFVFVNQAGTELYVIVQADRTSGLQQEFGLLVYPVADQEQTTDTGEQTALTAKALSVQNIYLGQATTLDGSGSTGDIQRYQWQLLKAPEGSSAALTNPSAVLAGFSPDVTGQYNFSLVVSDGGEDSAPQIVTLEVHEPVTSLNHRVLDAEYSHALDQIVSIGTSPDRLYLTDPDSQVTSYVDLPAAPVVLTVSPDGQQAAVGHNGLVTHIDLNNSQVISSRVISTDVADIVLTNEQYAYINPKTGYGTLYGINLLNGQETEHRGSYENSRIKLHPSGAAVYSANRGISPSDLEKYDVSTTSPVWLYDSPYHGEYEPCGNLWLSEDGARIFARCAYAYRSNSERDKDMVYSGKLSGLSYISHLTHSAAANQLFVIPEASTQYQNDNDADNTELRIYDYDFLLHNRTIDLHDFVATNKVHEAHGRFVFVNASGTKIYVIAQADETSGMLNDYGLLTYPVDYQPPVRVPAAWIDNQQKWLNFSETDNRIEYQTQQHCNCESAITQPMKLTERYQRMYDAEYSDNGGYIDYDIRQSLLTIARRFGQLQEAYEKGAHKIEVSYDPQYGFPASVLIDYNEFIADDEVSYTITDLVIREN